MEENNIYNRANALINEYTNFIESIKCRKTEECITLRHIIDLKAVLADINNVITAVYICRIVIVNSILPLRR